MATLATERGSVPSAALFVTFLFANTFLLDNIIRLAAGPVPGFASVYTLNYGAQVSIAMVVIAWLVIVASTFRRGTVSGLTVGAVKG